MLTPTATDTLTQATALAAIVTMLIGILRPFIEQLPFARPAAPTHDATLRLLNLALNVGLVMAAAAAQGQLTAAVWLPLTIQALAQTSGSHILFHSVTSSASGGSATPAPAQSAAVAISAPSLPSTVTKSSADLMGPLATLVAPSASAVADAVNAAIAAQANASK